LNAGIHEKFGKGYCVPGSELIGEEGLDLVEPPRALRVVLEMEVMLSKEERRGQTYLLPYSMLF
jgi:hypothetical protein